MKRKQIIYYLKDCDSLKAEIKKYSDTFNVADTQKYIKEVISEVSNDFIKNG